MGGVVLALVPLLGRVTLSIPPRERGTITSPPKVSSRLFSTPRCLQLHGHNYLLSPPNPDGRDLILYIKFRLMPSERYIYLYCSVVCIRTMVLTKYAEPIGCLSCPTDLLLFHFLHAGITCWFSVHFKYLHVGVQSCLWNRRGAKNPNHLNSSRSKGSLGLGIFHSRIDLLPPVSGPRSQRKQHTEWGLP